MSPSEQCIFGQGPRVLCLYYPVFSLFTAVLSGLVLSGTRMDMHMAPWRALASPRAYMDG